MVSNMSRVGRNPLGWIKKTEKTITDVKAKEEILVSKKTIEITKDHWIIPISAKSQNSLISKITELNYWLENEGNNYSIDDISYTLSCCRTHFNIRKIFIVKTIEELKEKLKKYDDNYAVDVDYSQSQIGNYISNYLEGKLVQWSELFKDKIVGKIPMPTYPFEKVRHWIEYTNDISKEQIVLDRFLDANVSDFEGVKFKKIFTKKKDDIFICKENNTYLNEYVFLEMLREAWNNSMSKSEITLKDIKFGQPIIIENEDIDLELRLIKYYDEYYCEILFEDKIVFQCCISEEVSNDNEEIRIFHKAMDNWDERDDKKTFTIKFDSNLLENENDIWLDPSSIYKLILKILEHEYKEDSKIYFPYEIGNFKIYKSLEQINYASGSIKEENKKDKGVYLNLSLFNSEGIKILDIDNLLMKKYNTSTGKGTYENIYAEYGWEQKNIEVNSEWNNKSDYIIFDDGMAKTSIEKLLQKEQVGIKNVIFVNKGVKFKKVRNNLYEIDPNKVDDYRKLFEKIKNIPENIIFNWSNKKFKINLKDVNEQLNDSIYPLISIIKEIQHIGIKQETNLIYVYTSAKDEEPIYKAIGSFLKTVNLESGKLLCKSVEIGNMTQKVLKNIIDELKNRDIEVKYNKGIRYIKSNSIKKLDDINETYNFEKDSVFLVTGGLGGVGKVICKYLEKNYNSTLIVTGRKDKKDSKVSKVISEFNKGKLIYIQSDISVENDVDKIIKYINKNKLKLSGIFHCAGVNKDSLLINKEVEEFKDVIKAKIFGTINIYNKILELNPKLLVLFSSISSVKGIVGQTDYSFANGFMDNFADINLTKNHSTKVVSINWTVWEEGSMKLTESNAKQLEEEIGYKMIPSKDAIDALNKILNSNLSNCIVGYGEKEKIENYILDNHKYEKESATYEDIDSKAFYDKTIEFLIGLFSKIFKLPIEKINKNTNFKDYGIDSVIVMNFNNHLEKYIKNISKVLLYQYQSIEELAKYVIENHRKEMLQVVGLLDKEVTENNNHQLVDEHEWNRLKSIVKNEKKKGYVIGKEDSYDDIAVIGMSGKFPKANDIENFWQNIINGRDCIDLIPKDRWDYEKYYDSDRKASNNGKMYSKWGGFLDNVDKFDPLFFNITPKEAELIDPQERLLLQEAWSILEDAGYSKERLEKYSKSYNGANVGVFTAVTTMTYQLLAADMWKNQIDIIPTSLQWSMANRVSYALNLNGPSMPVDTACSSSLVAIHLACQSLMRNECKMALVEGVNLYLHPARYIGMCQMNMLSPTGKCHTFGDKSDGFVPGEGVGGILLKPLSEAKRDGDNIYAVIKSTAVNHGGSTSGYKVPNPNAQAELIIKALEQSDINPRTISYIETHGTGTSLGDPIEIAGLVKAFEKFTDEKSYCSLGSVKPNIGHLESAAGIASIIKVILQMKNKILAPSINCDTINPNINLDNTPFYIQKRATEWQKSVYLENGEEVVTPRRAGVSSFGAGGSNCHIILEEYDNHNDSEDENLDGKLLFVLSAKSKERLFAYIKKIIKYIEENKEKVNLVDFIYTLQVGRTPMNHRIAIVIKSFDDLLKMLTSYINGENNEDILYSKLTKKDYEGELTCNYNINNLNEIAQCWITNKKIKWSDLYNNSPKIISLPTYPFAEERYWLPKNLKEKKIDGKSYIHPLIEKNISTLNEQKFSTIFTGEEFFIRDHVLKGKGILPGAVYVEMARKALELSLEKKITRLSNLTWINPIEFNNKERIVYTSIKVNEDRCLFEINTMDENTNSKVVNCQGEYSLFPQVDSINNLDVNNISNFNANHIISDNEFYMKYENRDYKYGSSMRSVKKAYVNGNEALIDLIMPEENNHNKNEYMLHPSLLDGVFQSISCVLYDLEKDNLFYMPYRVDDMEFFQEVNDINTAIINLEHKSNNEEILKFNMTILDSNNNICVKITNFTAKAIKTHIAKNTDLLDVLTKLQNGEIDINYAKEFLGGLEVD